VLQQELLEFKIFLGLLDETSARCWADALASRGEDVALDQRLYDDLGTCSDAVLAASPDDTDARFTRALAHVGPERQDLASARSEVDRLLSVDPTDANGLLLRASLALAERRNADARADLDVLDGMARPTASFLLGSPTDLRDVLERSEEAASGSTTTTTTTAPPVSGVVSTVPGAPVIPNAGGG
jgi:hypothetical protein